MIGDLGNSRGRGSESQNMATVGGAFEVGLLTTFFLKKGGPIVSGGGERMKCLMTEGKK